MGKGMLMMCLFSVLFVCVLSSDGNAMKISSKKNDDVIVGFRSLRAYMAAMLLDFLLTILPLLLFFTINLGVGSFLLANSLVSRQARGFPMLFLVALLRKWKNARQSISPLVVLGIARLLSTSGVDYQVKLFLGCLWYTFICLLLLVRNHIFFFFFLSFLLSFLSCFNFLGYQVCLINGLNVYLLSNERGTDIISQNKEGIFSIFGEECSDYWDIFFTYFICLPENSCSFFSGYWGMYLVGVQLGSYLFFGNSMQVLRSNRWQKLESGFSLFCFCMLLTVILDRKVKRVSRRTCNVAYVTFVLAQNLQANVLTGVVNLFIETLFASSSSALAILVVYAFVLLLLI
ncbi:hypothetical protein RHSIM_Rhsim11G0016800 [Rhododendron simsii]|uniref:Uncharacterized protein n=1 Tax=Rhododendron simsii TaxID=118357 RepID=A0A834G5R2_RHOSS|nr:hypothetical protein RHSIM_Rhsim11G0016800 [Rhododendron simsii]